MRLLRTADKKLLDRHKVGDDAPYVIFSHKWLDQDGHEEITHEDITSFDQVRRQPSKALSALKINQLCQLASLQGYEYVWLDTCCIDQKNPAELSASINSMFQWYQEAAVCYVYLAGHDALNEKSDPMQDIWFSRGWTLQELVAPRRIEFFDKNWLSIGVFDPDGMQTARDLSLMNRIFDRTGIDKSSLMGEGQLEAVSVARRMSWYRGRTTGVPEDSAYCLMGIFSVNMPTIYGEGRVRAFRRLQEEIMRYSDDHSLFAWKLPPSPTASRRHGLLAPSPECFQQTGHHHHVLNRHNNRPYIMTNKGLSIDLYLLDIGGGKYVASLDCPTGKEHWLSFFLARVNNDTEQYFRVDASEMCQVHPRGKLKSIYVQQPR
ncbi:hypothetical protein K431DRAFT_283002 [Polychaeton citri CBS 116435]|uniref:HET-domain-containing protein n=1 Tax=Polychaeton citri CBS 116435 TaxID=1314669 RepID=A0A9P4QEQ3_9PEZI|nr:hypothetical protein K431DRAFT_283002 [Polychaeton citri CBS 116435]